MATLYAPPSTNTESIRSFSKESQDTQSTVSHTRPPAPSQAGSLTSNASSAVYSSYTFKTADLKKLFSNISGSDASNNVKSLEVLLKPHQVTLTQASTISLDSGREEQALYLAAATEEQIKAAVDNLGQMGAPGKPKSVFRATSRELSVTPRKDYVQPGTSGQKQYNGYAGVNNNQHYNNNNNNGGKTSSPPWAKYSPVSEHEYGHMEQEYMSSRQASLKKKMDKQSFDQSLKDTVELLKLESRERAQTLATPGLAPATGGYPTETRTVSSPSKFSPGILQGPIGISDAKNVASPSSNELKNGGNPVYSSQSNNSGLYGASMFDEEHGSGIDCKYQVPQRRPESSTRKVPRLRIETDLGSPTRLPPHLMTGEPSRSAADQAGSGNVLPSSEDAPQWGPYGGRKQQSTFSATAAPFYSRKPPVSALPTYDPLWSGPVGPAPSNPPARSGNPYNPGSGLQPPVNPSSYPSLEQLQLRATTTVSPHKYPPDIQRSIDKRAMRYETPLEMKDPRQFLRFNENMKPRPKLSDEMFTLNAMRAAEAAAQNHERVYASNGPRFPSDVHEDKELSIANNIPYRLRPPPLTGPRYIR